MFLKRAVIENGIPFRMTMPKEVYQATRGYRAMQEISESAAKNGLADMSLDEINAEIAAYRSEILCQPENEKLTGGDLAICLTVRDVQERPCL